MPNQEDFRHRIEKAKELLIQRNVAKSDEISPCTGEDIKRIEADTGGRLPLAYSEFLTKMGRGAGRFYEGTDVFYPDLLGLTGTARRLVAKDGANIALPPDAVVIAMHQGYQFLFIKASEGEDPPVYYYMEKSGEFVKKADRFSNFMIDVARDEW